MSDTQPLVRPTAAPRRRVVHRLRPAGGGERASCTICSTVSGGTAWSRRPVFGRSDNPSTPSCTKRRRIRDTASGDRSTRANLRAAQVVGTQENHTGTTDQTRGGRCACHERFQRLLLFTSRSNAVRVGHRHALDHVFDLISTAVH